MLRRLSCLTLVLWGLACGAQSTQGPRPRSEFTADDARLFEGGVDLIPAPDQLEGQWRLDWDRDLDRRISQADLIAIGSVTTLRADTDLEQRTNYQVVFAVEQTLLGKAYSSELTLISRGGDAGYASIEEHRAHLLNRKLIAFVKYAAAETGGVSTHFHLSAPSDTVQQRIAAFDSEQHPANVQVIEHNE